jgi:hypothetical protein
MHFVDTQREAQTNGAEREPGIDQTVAQFRRSTNRPECDNYEQTQRTQS